MRRSGSAWGALAGHDDRLPVQDAKCAFFGIQPQFGFARLFVRTVALIAVLGKDGPDIPVEIDLNLRARFRCGELEREAQQKSGREAAKTSVPTGRKVLV